MNEEYLYKLSLLEQQANQIQEQISLIVRKIQELSVLELSLGKIEKNKEKQILASIGEGIYIDTDLRDKKLLVNVGKNIFVHKSISETKKVIDKQNKLLEDVKKKMEGEIEKISIELHTLVEKVKDNESGETQDNNVKKVKEK